MELAREDPAYEDVASKFWEHFLHIANAMNHLGNDGAGMWDAGGRVLLRRSPRSRRRSCPDEGSLDGRV